MDNQNMANLAKLRLCSNHIHMFWLVDSIWIGPYILRKGQNCPYFGLSDMYTVHQAENQAIDKELYIFLLQPD